MADQHYKKWVDGAIHEHRMGHTFCKECWPPRGRGRGESLLSPRRVQGQLRGVEAMRLHVAGHTWEDIAAALGYKDRSGPWRARQAILRRVNAQPERPTFDEYGLTEEDWALIALSMDEP